MKKRFLTLGSLAFLASLSLYANEAGQVNYGMQNILLAQGSGSGVMHQYQYQKKTYVSGKTASQGQGNMSEQEKDQGQMSEQDQGNMSGN